MIRQFLLVAILFGAPVFAFAQAPLPAIAVKNYNNKIIVSWENLYTKPVTTLNIQRSYDSLKNYYTIGSVLSPQSRENGFADANPPYYKMYYRVFVAFEGGSYVITPSARPVKDTSMSVAIGYLLNGLGRDTVNPDSKSPYYSATIFTAKDNNVVIHLPDAAAKKYSIKFFDDTEKFLFEITKLKEDYVIVEKGNFVHSGWFRFELFENGKQIETNMFQIQKDIKKP